MPYGSSACLISVIFAIILLEFRVYEKFILAINF